MRRTAITLAAGVASLGLLMVGCSKGGAANNAVAPVSPAAASPVASATVPFVGCASDGQQGPKPGPSGAPVSIAAYAASASQLAYYSAGEGSGVLAPRGWHCFASEGSSGAALLVAPTPVGSDDVVSGDFAGSAGPAVQLSYLMGGTSGRFQAARIAARVFPGHQAFVQGVIGEGVEPASNFPSGPYPGDKLTARGDSLVEYETAANAEGLGTAQSQLKPNGEPIEGAAILLAPDNDIQLLAARLPLAQRGLAPLIVAQLEADSARLASKAVESSPSATTPSAQSR